MDQMPEGFSLDHDGAPAPSAQMPAGFTLDQASNGATGDVPQGFQLDDEKYGSTGQQVIAGLEGAAKGIAGPLATYAETKLGVSPEDITGRAEANPWTHGLSEAAGFGVGALTGTGEAGLLAKAGEGAASIAGLGEAANVSSKLAKGAVTAATEMGLYQAGDEASKWILNAPQTPGSVVANVGLATLLGGVTGPAFAGLGMVAKKALDSTGLKEFTDRLAFRRANIDPVEMQRNEAENAISTFNNMSSEVGGTNGLKAKAIQKVLPEAMTPEIFNQVQQVSEASMKAVDDLRKAGAPERLVSKLENDTNRFWSGSLKDPNETFDAMNDLKGTLQSYSKGDWGPFAIPRHHEAYDFIQATKSLSRDVRLALEDSKVWGGAADIQKELNGSWSKALPAVKDFEKKFMTKVGDQLEISADKFNTYNRQGLKSTTTTDRQKMLGNFIDAMDGHFKAVDKIYEKAGIENPFQAVGMSSLKESVEKPSTGARLADMWHDKLSAHALGDTAGSAIGGALGHPLGHGLEGVYLGRELLGPVFSGLLKPIIEKYPNVDLGAFQQALSMAKAIEKGNSNLSKAAASVIGASKTFPSHVIPSATDLEKLDDRAREYGGEATSMSNVSGKIGYYMQGHETAVAKTAGDAVAYLNSQRPQPTRALPLDNMPKASAAEKAEYNRTLQIAQQPLMAFKHISEGTLIPKDVETIKTLYPDYYSKMSEELMKTVVDHVHEDNPVDYHTKQMMSLFLGQPLDSTLTPQSIQASQSVFAKQQVANQAAAEQAPKKSTSRLSHAADDHLVGNESSIRRRNSAKG